jgi:hypothetical protein
MRSEAAESSCCVDGGRHAVQVVWPAARANAAEMVDDKAPFGRCVAMLGAEGDDVRSLIPSADSHDAIAA